MVGGGFHLDGHITEQVEVLSVGPVMSWDGLDHYRTEF